jgi:hypothetical protein
MNANSTITPVSLASQKLAIDFATEVATERLKKVNELLQLVHKSEMPAVDALFAIRELAGKHA